MLRDWGCDYIQGRLIGLASSERPWDAAGAKPAAGGGLSRRPCESRDP